MQFLHGWEVVSMKDKNIFLGSLKVFKRKNQPSDSELMSYGFSYDHIKGAWIDLEGRFMMIQEGPKPRPRPRPSSKKEDVETDSL